MSSDEASLEQDPRDLSTVEHLREGLLDNASGLSDETRLRLRHALAELPAAASDADAARAFADAAVRSWVGEVIEACEGQDALVSELEHVAPIIDAESARAARQRAMSVHGRVDTVIEKAAVHHAAQAAEAAGRMLEGGDEDDARTAAHNAGRVLGELAVAGSAERAVEFARAAADEAATR
jgi:hypothetical protein